MLWVCLSLLCQQKCTVTSCMQTSHLHLPVCAESHHRARLESTLVSVSTRLQYKCSPPFQQPRSCSLSTRLFLLVFQNRNTLTCHCTSGSAHWNCSRKGDFVQSDRRTLDFIAEEGRQPTIFHSGARTLSSGAFTVVKPLLEQHTQVQGCVHVCARVHACVWKHLEGFIISEDLSPCLSYIVGLNLALRYCVYLAAVFSMKLVWRKLKFMWPPCKSLWLMMLIFRQDWSGVRFYFSNVFPTVKTVGVYGMEKILTKRSDKDSSIT